MDKDDLALIALEGIFRDHLLRLGGIDGPMVRVISLSRNPDGNGLIQACIVGSDGNERVVPVASLFDATSPYHSPNWLRVSREPERTARPHPRWVCAKPADSGRIHPLWQSKWRKASNGKAYRRV